ncbi:MAG: polysulfide reductase NrfD [Sulfurimonas sp.]|nr:polysulfide reductase NrfD [Sulfurimonas sp.]
MALRELVNKIVPIKEDFSIKSLLGFKKTPLNVLVFFMIMGLLLLLVWGLAQFLMHGHHAYNVTREHPWGLLISGYIFFVGTSTGLCIIASLGHVFGIKEFNHIGKRTTLLAIITLLPGFIIILTEIGHPVTMMIYNILTPGITSAIWWMGTLYGLVLTFIILEFGFALRGNHKWAVRLGIGGLIADVAAFTTLGSVFAYLVARPIANGPFIPLYFLLTAVVSGAFFMFMIYGFKHKLNFPEEVKITLVKLAKILGLLLAVTMFFEWWRIITAIYGDMPERADTMMRIIASTSFQLEVLFAMVIPFVIILVSKGTALKALFFSSIAALISIFLMRNDMVHHAQMMPMQMLKKTEYQLAPTWIEYSPSPVEWAIAVGALGVCFLLYYVAEKAFDLDEDDHH